jgi:two-component system, OmpR family, sensor histidine kinase TctE
MRFNPVMPPAKVLAEPGMMAGLRHRLLVMLLIPLGLLALASAWLDYSAAGSAAVQQDQQLQRLVPLLADSVVAPGATSSEAPVLLLAPPIEEFLKARNGLAGFAISSVDGRRLSGDGWMAHLVPSTAEPEFHSEVNQGITYRIVAQRVHTAAGEVIVLLADGSDLRQNWLRALALKVLIPNLLLVVAAALAVNWAIRRALQPLMALKEAVAHRSPRDLSALDTRNSPEEVRPLVESLNRLFALVNAQAESQRRFIADAAHQLRTPLAGLQAQVEALAQAVNVPPADIHTEKSLKTQQNRAQAAIKLGANEINQLRTATRRTSQLAHQLLALSRADAQIASAQPMQSVDLVELCANALATHLDAASAKQIDLGVETGAACTMGHEWLLQELLNNLVDNAIKYTPAATVLGQRQGSVTIRCGHVTGAAFLEVEDNGPGIAPTERARVTERFYRVQGTQGDGSGLGLAIADEIARVHGAHLQWGSDNGPDSKAIGLRVTVVFPR